MNNISHGYSRVKAQIYIEYHCGNKLCMYDEGGDGGKCMCMCMCVYVVGKTPMYQ